MHSKTQFVPSKDTHSGSTAFQSLVSAYFPERPGNRPCRVTARQWWGTEKRSPHRLCSIQACPRRRVRDGMSTS